MNIDQLITKEFSGVISICESGKHVFQNAYGFADRANEVPNNLNTRFGTASAGKAFVATAVLYLVEQGLLHLDSTIGELLSFDLKQIDPDIQVCQLLNHTSGIPDYFDETVMHDYEDLWFNLPNYRIRKSSDLIPLFIDKPMMYARGEKFQYNNTGYVVLGLIIEAVTAKPFDMYLKEILFDPCEMSDTGYFELDRLPARCAFSYIHDPEEKSYRTNIFSVDAKGSGAGGAFTTASDIEKFWIALTNGRIISQVLVQSMLSPQVAEGCYGYGFWLMDQRIPMFQGSDPGVEFITSYDLGRQIMITIISNCGNDVVSLHKQIVEIMKLL